MKRKVKIFCRETYNSHLLEKDINEWLDENENVEILDRLQTSHDFIIVTIFYRYSEEN